MTTRFYLPGDGPGMPSDTPVLSPLTGWTGSSNVAPRLIVTYPRNSGGATLATLGTTGQTRRTRMLAYYTPTMAELGLSGTLAGSVKVAATGENWLGNNSRGLVMRAWVVDENLTVRKAVLLPLTDGQNSNNGGTYVRTLQAELTPQAVAGTDRIYLEVGAFHGADGTGAGDFYMYPGNDNAGASDMVFAYGAPASGRQWIEFDWIANPNPPTGLHLVEATPTSLEVAWTAPDGGAAPTGYQVRVDAGAPVDVGLVTAHTFTGLTPATTYALEVRTVAGATYSAWVPLEATTLEPGAADRRWWTHRLAAALGLDPVNDQPVVEVRTWTGDGFELSPSLSSALVSYTVTYGRRDTVSRTEPLTGSIVFATPRLEATPEVATRLQVALSPAVCGALGLDVDDGIRFTGEVTDPAVAHARRLTTVTVAGRLGRAGRMPVDGTTWPVEAEHDRVGRILAAARVDLEVGALEAGTVNLAVPTRVETVATLLDQVTASTTGQVLEQPSGVIDWHASEHRRDAPVAVTLPAGQVLRDVTWSQRLSSLVNDLDVKTAAGVVVNVTDPESGDPNRYGPWPASLDTILTDSSDALDVGVDVVARRADPVWQLPDLTVDLVRTVPTADLAGVLALRHGSLLEVVDLPAAFPNPDGRLFVEGIVETATARTWSLALSVSDPVTSGVGLRWIDWPDTDEYQWQDLDPDLTWLDLARITDPADTL